MPPCKRKTEFDPADWLEVPEKVRAQLDPAAQANGRHRRAGP